MSGNKTLRDIYFQTKKSLDSGIEARELFGFVTGKSFYDLPAVGNEVADSAIVANLENLITKRLSGEPLQYLIGNWDFYGLNFHVGSGVLVPRSDTEILVDEALKIIGGRKNTEVVDLCSGTGCIAIAIDKNSYSHVTAVELSSHAYEYIEKNIAINDSKVTAINTDLNSYRHPVPIDLLVSNPPYIPADDLLQLQIEVKHEPVMALDGGKDGLDFYRAISERFYSQIAIGGHLCFEVGINQSLSVTSILENSGFVNISVVNDYSGIPRVVTCKKKGGA